MAKSFINNEELLNTIQDIENYISKNYKLTQLEYEIILNLLRERMVKQKLEKKRDGLVGSTIKRVREMMT